LRRTHHAALCILFAGSAACAAATLGACWDMRVATPPTLDGGLGLGLADGGPRCGAPQLFDDVLIVDEAETRAQLKAALSSGSGLVAVRFAGCDMQIVPGCSGAGAYKLARVPATLDHLQYGNAVEIRAAFPAASPALRSAPNALLALLTVGVYQADRTSIAVTGTCADASHVIVAVRVGAFWLVAGGETLGTADGLLHCIDMTAKEGDLGPECSEPLRVIVAAIPPPPVAPCPSGQSPSGAACVPAFPAVDPASPHAAEIRDTVAKLASAKAEARGNLLLRLADLYEIASPSPVGDMDRVVLLKMFLDDPDLATHPGRNGALLRDRASLLRLGRAHEALEASRRLVHEFPDHATTAPAYLDVARSYCENGEVGTANVLFQDIVKRFGREKDEIAVDAVAQAKKGCPKGQTAAPGKP
jgi:hypothetical protein